MNELKSLQNLYPLCIQYRLQVNRILRTSEVNKITLWFEPEIGEIIPL